MGHEANMGWLGFAIVCGLIIAYYVIKDVRRWRREERENEARRKRLLEEERRHSAESYGSRARILTKGATVRDAR